KRVIPQHFDCEQRRQLWRRLCQTPRRSLQAPPQKIERSCGGITIRCGGSHRQTQRMERSLRARSTVLGDAAIFCAHFLYAKGCAVLDLVQPYFAGESSCAELHWASRRNYRGNLLSIPWSGSVPFSGNSARV